MGKNEIWENELKLLSEIEIPKELVDLIPNFLRRRQIEVSTLSQLVIQENFSELESFGHKIKGHGAGYGFDRISDYGVDIQAFAKLRNTKKLKSIIFEYEKYIGFIVGKFEIHPSDEEH